MTWLRYRENASRKHFRLDRSLMTVVFAFMALVLLAGCTGGITETSWGQMRLLGDPATILFAFSDRIVQIDPLDGQPVELTDEEGQVRVDDQGNPRVWQITSPGGSPTHFYTQPASLNDNTLLAAAYEQRLYEIDLASARVNDPAGRSVGSNLVGSPLLTENALYVPLGGGGVVAYNPSTLEELWRFPTRFGVWSQPLLVNDTLYVTSLDHFLYALEPDTGAVRWQLDLGGAIAAPPLVQDDFLYVGTFARKLYKISATGAIIAQYDTNDWIWGTPALADGVLYAADLKGFVYALRDEGESFTPVWTPRQVAGRGIRATPVIIGDQVVVGSRDHFLYWINRETGVETLRRELRGEVLSDMLVLQPGEQGVDVSEPLLIVSTLAREELLVAYTVDNGERRWVYSR